MTTETEVLQKYHDRCACGNIWRGNGRGVRVVGFTTLRCDCKRLWGVTRAYIKNLG